MANEPLQRPVVLYDGQCGFCKRHVARWSALAGGAIEFLPYQGNVERFPGITTDAVSRAVHLIEPDGTLTRGAEAVFRIAALSRKRPWLQSCYEKIPAFRSVTETGYEWIAAHRNLVDPIDRVLFGRSNEPTSHRLTVSIFLRALGVIYLIAFVSLWVQVHGLIGSHGILPISNYLQMAREALSGSERYRELPTLCWLNSSDGMLSFLCGGGVVVALLLIAGEFPIVMLFGRGGLYLSLARSRQ